METCRKLATLESLRMLKHPHQIQYQFVASFPPYLIEKINFITHFFLKILWRNRKLFILGNLGMPSLMHLKR